MSCHLRQRWNFARRFFQRLSIDPSKSIKSKQLQVEQGRVFWLRCVFFDVFFFQSINHINPNQQGLPIFAGGQNLRVDPKGSKEWSHHPICLRDVCRCTCGSLDAGIPPNWNIFLRRSYNLYIYSYYNFLLDIKVTFKLASNWQHYFWLILEGRFFFPDALSLNFHLQWFKASQFWSHDFPHFVGSRGAPWEAHGAFVGDGFLVNKRHVSFVSVDYPTARHCIYLA